MVLTLAPNSLEMTKESLPNVIELIRRFGQCKLLEQFSAPPKFNMDVWRGLHDIRVDLTFEFSDRWHEFRSVVVVCHLPVLDLFARTAVNGELPLVHHDQTVAILQ